MKNYIFNFIALVILPISGSFMQVKNIDKDVFLWYDPEIPVMQSCVGQEVITYINFNTDAIFPVEIHSFSLGNTPFKIFIDDKEISKSNTIQITDNKPLQIKLRYTIDSQRKHSIFAFQTNLEKHEQSEIKINHGEIAISSDDVRNRVEKIIEVSPSCLDSFKVNFPYGGTTTSVAIFADSNQLQGKPIKYLSYMIMDRTNFMTFTKADTGRYYVSFGSCHWGNDFWISIK